MEEIKILEILTKKAEKYNVSFCGVESNAIIETVNEALSLHNVSQQRELLLGFQKSEWFDLYEQGVLEYKDAIEKYLA